MAWLQESVASSAPPQGRHCIRMHDQSTLRRSALTLAHGAQRIVHAIGRWLTLLASLEFAGHSCDEDDLAFINCELTTSGGSGDLGLPPRKSSAPIDAAELSSCLPVCIGRGSTRCEVIPEDDEIPAGPIAEGKRGRSTADGSSVIDIFGNPLGVQGLSADDGGASAGGDGFGRGYTEYGALSGLPAGGWGARGIGGTRRDGGGGVSSQRRNPFLEFDPSAPTAQPRQSAGEVSPDALGGPRRGVTNALRSAARGLSRSGSRNSNGGGGTAAGGAAPAATELAARRVSTRSLPAEPSMPAAPGGAPARAQRSASTTAGGLGDVLAPRGPAASRVTTGDAAPTVNPMAAARTTTRGTAGGTDSAATRAASPERHRSRAFLDRICHAPSPVAILGNSLRQSSISMSSQATNQRTDW
jgi:hypothetical protein